MSKILTVLIVALIFEAIGVVLLSRGMKQIGSLERFTLSETGRWALRGATNPSILMGVALESVFFAGLLFLLSREDVSVVWPLTSLGFVLTTLSAKFLLGEHVTPVRWAGVTLIVLGAGLITWSEKRKPLDRQARPEQSGTSWVGGKP